MELPTEPDSQETESKNEKGKKQGGDHTTVTVGDYCHQAKFHHFPVMSGMHDKS